MDRELEQQIASQRPGGPALPDGDGQGVLLVRDHLAEAPSASPPTPERGTPVASVPSAGAGDHPEPRDGVDAEGFRTVFEGDRLVRRERLGADGRPEVVLHYDTRGRVVRREESSRLDGRLDIASSYVDGTLQLRESDTDGDGRTETWAFYDGAGTLQRMESLNADGRRRTETYRAGRVVERLDGDLLSVFDDAGRLVKQGRKSAGDRMLAWRHFDGDGDVVREEEFGDDGTLSAVAHYEDGRLVRRELYDIDEGAFSRVPLVTPEAGAR
jgi:hypothetical protein